MEARLKDRQRVRRVIGRQIEQHDVVRGVAIRRHLRRREHVRQDGPDVRCRSDVSDGSRRRGFECRKPRLESVGMEDDDDRRRRGSQLRLEHLARLRRRQVGEREAAGP